MGLWGLAIKKKVRSEGRRKKPNPASSSLSCPFVPTSGVPNCSEPCRLPPVPMAPCGPVGLGDTAQTLLLLLACLCASVLRPHAAASLSSPSGPNRDIHFCKDVTEEVE